ncbi:hypothetical protein [Stappia sp. P2PMeth1]|uniref:hypothetical protein n=1 Tax=Stappia sp. P2PMeth1 TaxID=2003586 RepID=UPI001646B4F2|nr:hypothetical protein [Stappia sp. P2PMeth1]
MTPHRLLAALLALAGPALPLPAAANEVLSRTEVAIDWPSAQAEAAAAPQARATADAFAQAAGANGVRLPVLLLPVEEWGMPRFVHQTQAYAAAYRLEGAQLSVLGWRSAIEASGALTLHHDVQGYESIGDGADYSLVRHGASYVLRLTCDEPLTDPRCIEPAFLSGAAAALVSAGGSEK